MQGYLSLVLHAHLPFVRHPEHEQSLEEIWLHEAITETYIPLLQLLDNWKGDGIAARLTLTLSPTLCSMLRDSLLQQRYSTHLNQLIELAEKEIFRTHFEPAFQPVAKFYHERLLGIRKLYERCGSDLVGCFRQAQDEGQVEIITSAATHALLPLLVNHPPSLRAQILVARDHYVECFGRAPRGIWLPECAYVESIEPALKEAGLRWFILETHGLLNAAPHPRFGNFAPIITPHGLAAFARDVESSRQVWSRTEGYPGDPRYREFYRDIGFDLDYEYVGPHLAAGHRGFTGIKYHRITGGAHKEPYEREAALKAAETHAEHFLSARLEQTAKVGAILERPPVIVSPYDAELFGHWWYEGPEFLDFLIRKAAKENAKLRLITPGDYLEAQPTNQLATPAGSSWGEEGYWRVWLNEKTEWIFSHLYQAQERMTELAGRCRELLHEPSGYRTMRTPSPRPSPQGEGERDSGRDESESSPTQCASKKVDALKERALKQAARELLLAQASDWPFIIRAGTSAEYARKRIEEHLLRFTRIYDEVWSGHLDEQWLEKIESDDNIFPHVNPQYWRVQT